MAKVLKSKSKPKKTKKTAESRPNARPREVVIRDVARKLAVLEQKRADLNDQAKLITNMNIKGELGMSKKNFMIAYGQFLLEPQERADLFSVIREVHTAMKTGQQTNFLDVIEKQDREIIASLPAAISTEPAEAYDAGHKIGLKGGSISDNPYDGKTAKPLHRQWDDGHHDGLMQYIETMHGPKAQESPTVN